MARNQSKLFEMNIFGMWRRKKYTITRFKRSIQRKQIWTARYKHNSICIAIPSWPLTIWAASSELQVYHFYIASFLSELQEMSELWESHN